MSRLSNLKPYAYKALWAVFLVALIVWVCEMGFRLYIQRADPGYASDLKRLTRLAQRDTSAFPFEPHPYLGYVRSDTVLDRYGVRIKERYYSFYQRPEAVRVACLGGSAVMNQFAQPRFLPAYLAPLPVDATFEVMDFGCEGWTSQETVINYAIRVSHFKPDIVLVHTGDQEGFPWTWPDFQLDYAHYRQVWSGRPAGRIERWLLRRSWLLAHFFRQEGSISFDLKDYTVRQVPPSLLQEPNPAGEGVYEHNLWMLADMVKKDGGQIVFAPMPYNRSSNETAKQEVIERTNEIMRRTARKMEIPLADADALMKDKPGWFTDLFRVNDQGQYFKTQVFTKAIYNVLEKGEETASVQPDAVPVRDIELRWEYDTEKAKDFHIQVQVEGEKEFRYLGRTGDAEANSFRWKQGEPGVSPVLAKEFQDGPQFGVHYSLRVAVISRETNKVFDHITVRKGLKIVER